MERPTFSQSWSRVNRLTPTLRPQVQIRRRSFRGMAWYVVHDPISNQFFRLNPVAYHLVGLLDGKRSVDEVWKMTLDKFGDDAPTQQEVIGLLSQLNQSNLLRIDLPPDAQPLLARQQQRTAKKIGQSAMSLMFLQIPLFNPDHLLQKLYPLFRPMLSRGGLVLWAAWLIFALSVFLPNFREFWRDTGSLLAPANWGWMIVIFIVTKAWHELGHGLMCRRFGGAVPETGVMMLVMLPCPYMDTTSAWSFDSKWKRILVGAAGMMFELTLAAGAAIVWVNADSGTLTKQLAHNVVLLASVATILFNANPLMRFDGYFMLSDVLEVPNLYERSNRHLHYLAQKYAFGLKHAQPVSSQQSEKSLLTLFGIAAAVYRVIIMFGITLYIAGFAFTIGLMLAAWTLITWLCIPTGKFLHWLFTSPALYRKRARAFAVTGGVLAVLLLVLGIWPMPEHRRTQGVVEAAQRQDVVVGADGFVQTVEVEAGDFVKQGQVLMRLRNPEWEARKLELEGQITALKITQREALAGKPTERQMADARLKAMQEEQAELAQQMRDLVLISPRNGRLVAPALRALQGAYLKRGKQIGQIIDPQSLRVTALVDQAQNTLVGLHQVGKVEMRTASQKSLAIEGRVQQVFDSGWSQLPHPALGYQGGGLIPTDSQDQHGMTTLRPQFTLWLSLPTESQQVNTLPGERVYVRFTLAERRPWLHQWAHRLRQLFREMVMI